MVNVARSLHGRSTTNQSTSPVQALPLLLHQMDASMTRSPPPEEICWLIPAELLSFGSTSVTSSSGPPQSPDTESSSSSSSSSSPLTTPPHHPLLQVTPQEQSSLVSQDVPPLG